MAGGLEKMTETLNTVAPGQIPQLPNGVVMSAGMGDSMDASAQVPGVDRQFDFDGDLFFDYDMSFGLSPVFRFDPNMLSIDGSTSMQYGEPDYAMRPPQ